MQVGRPVLGLFGHFHRCCPATDTHLELGGGLIVHFLCLDLPDVVPFYFIFFPKKGKDNVPVPLQALLPSQSCLPVVMLCAIQPSSEKHICKVSVWGNCQKMCFNLSQEGFLSLSLTGLEKRFSQALCETRWVVWDLEPSWQPLCMSMVHDL